jgi:AhpD family alkylhydroperoxidase
MTIMQARMKSPLMVLPDALPALLAVNESTATESLPFITRKLVHLRASQINGCSVCVDMHSRELKKVGETDERLFAVAAWRDTPYLNDAERAALALTEAVTRINDREKPVSDEVWDEAARHYDETALAALTMQIALINLFNRINIATGQVVVPPQAARADAA